MSDSDGVALSTVKAKRVIAQGVGTSVHALSGWIKQCVKTDLRAHGTQAHGMTQALETQVHARSGCVAHGVEHLRKDSGVREGSFRVILQLDLKIAPAQQGSPPCACTGKSPQQEVRACSPRGCGAGVDKAVFMWRTTSETHGRTCPFQSV